MGMFDEMSTINKQFIADAIITVIKLRKCSPQIINNYVNIIAPTGATEVDKEARERICKETTTLLSNIGVIAALTDIQDDGTIPCVIQCWNNLHPAVKDLLKEYNYSEEFVRELLHELPDEEKAIVSEIINADEEHEWTSIADDFPPEDHLVAIRVCDPTAVSKENANQKVVLEDIKIASWPSDETVSVKGLEQKRWVIEPPYPFIEYTPMVDHDHIAQPNVMVSHWREVSDDEVREWHNRYDPINTYGYLSIAADDEHSRDVYQALCFGYNLIRNVAKNEPNPQAKVRFEYLGDILSDLAGCFDRGGDVHNEAVDAYKMYNRCLSVISQDPNCHDEIADHIAGREKDKTTTTGGHINEKPV